VDVPPTQRLPSELNELKNLKEGIRIMHELKPKTKEKTMRTCNLSWTIVVLLMVGTLSAQVPFELTLTLGQNESTFDATLTNISSESQVVRRGGKGGYERNLSLVIVEAGGDSMFVQPSVVDTENSSRNLRSGDSLVFHITLEDSEIPGSNSYSVQLIYHSIFKKYKQLHENSPLRRAYQGDVFSNVIMITE